MSKYRPQLDVEVVRKIFSHPFTKRRLFRIAYKTSIKVYKRYEIAWEREDDKEFINFLVRRKYTYSNFYRRHSNKFGEWDCECSDFCIKKSASEKKLREALLSVPIPNFFKDMAEITAQLPVNSGNTLRLKGYKE